MKSRLNIAFFGSSLVSAYWNGAATYYRGIIRALDQLGHSVTFYEPDAYDRQKHRDIPDPDWARVVVYQTDTTDDVYRALSGARNADLAIKTSGVGAFDQLLESAILELKAPHTLVAFWDVDAPATLDRLASNPHDPFHALVPRYDLILTYGGGEPVVSAYELLGARACIPIYNALDPDTHHPVPADPRFACDLALLANRLPDREARVEEFFLNVAARLPQKEFVLGGSGWAGKPLTPNITYVNHVYTKDHNAFNSTPRAVLNVNRESMARYGFSPPKQRARSSMKGCTRNCPTDRPSRRTNGRSAPTARCGSSRRSTSSARASAKSCWARAARPSRRSVSRPARSLGA